MRDPDDPLAYFGIPDDLPDCCPGVIVVGLRTGGTLYYSYEDPAEARRVWDANTVPISPGEKAFLFQEGVLVAFKVAPVAIH